MTTESHGNCHVHRSAPPVCIAILKRRLLQKSEGNFSKQISPGEFCGGFLVEFLGPVSLKKQESCALLSLIVQLMSLLDVYPTLAPPRAGDCISSWAVYISPRRAVAPCWIRPHAIA